MEYKNYYVIVVQAMRYFLMSNKKKIVTWIRLKCWIMNECVGKIIKNINYKIPDIRGWFGDRADGKGKPRYFNRQKYLTCLRLCIENIFWIKSTHVSLIYNLNPLTTLALRRGLKPDILVQSDQIFFFDYKYNQIIWLIRLYISTILCYTILW